MKLASPKLFLVLASAALVLAGCSKKPQRPDPSATALGQSVGPGGTGLSSTPLNPILDNGLVDRGVDPFGPDGMNRSALATNTVYFDFDQSAIKASERPKLKAAKEYLDKNPGTKLVLEGHCDWRGTAEYNLGLGDRRANAVKKYLLSIGVSADKLDTLSKGSLDAKPNAAAAEMEKDRRVDLLVSKAAK
jgi:peptidoglycan-associated lipoprotein